MRELLQISVNACSQCIIDFVCIAAFVSPMSVNATLGSTATFNCSTNATRFSVVWLVNGSLLHELNAGITAQQDGRAYFLHIPAREKFNNTSVVCELTIRGSVVRSVVLSAPAVLRVQGMFNFCM